MGQTSVLVIGGGVVGTSVSYRLAVAGASVTLLEAGAIGGGTTSTTFGMTVAPRKTPYAHFALAVAGATEHRRLAEELDVAHAGGDWMYPIAAFEWAATQYEDRVIATRLRRLRQWGYPVEEISVADLRAAEPHVDVDETVTRIVGYPDETWYDAPLLACRLAEAAQRYGAVVHPYQPVVGIERRRASVAARTQDGAVHVADRMVICAGPQAQRVAAMGGCHLPVRGVAGLLVTTATVPSDTLRSVILQPHANIRPTGDGRLLAHSYTTEGTLPDGINADDHSHWAEQTVHEASRVLPRFGRAGAAHSGIGVRPVPADGLPIVGWLDPQQHIYALASHSGVNLAPVLARHAAPEILNGTAGDVLAPFRPDRPGLRDPDAQPSDESMREMTRIFDDNGSA